MWSLITPSSVPPGWFLLSALAFGATLRKRKRKDIGLFSWHRGMGICTGLLLGKFSLAPCQGSSNAMPQVEESNNGLDDYSFHPTSTLKNCNMYLQQGKDHTRSKLTFIIDISHFEISQYNDGVAYSWQQHAQSDSSRRTHEQYPGIRSRIISVLAEIWWLWFMPWQMRVR